MGWLRDRGRRWPLEPPTFAQTVALVRDVIATHPGATDGDLREWSKRRHLAAGFQYESDAICRALDALTDPGRTWDRRHRSSKHSDRWTLPRPRPPHSGKPRGGS